MPKSGQNRKRQGARAKKKMAARSQTTSAVAQSGQPQRQVVAPVQSPAYNVAQVSRTAVPPPNVKLELRRIGILTAIVLVILAVLSRVLT